MNRLSLSEQLQQVIRLDEVSQKLAASVSAPEPPARDAPCAHNQLRAMRASKLLEVMHTLREHHDKHLDADGQRLRTKLIRELSRELLNGWIDERCSPVGPVLERDPIGRRLGCSIAERRKQDRAPELGIAR